MERVAMAGPDQAHSENCGPGLMHLLVLVHRHLRPTALQIDSTAEDSERGHLLNTRTLARLVLIQVVSVLVPGVAVPRGRVT